MCRLIFLFLTVAIWAASAQAQFADKAPVKKEEVKKVEGKPTPASQPSLKTGESAKVPMPTALPGEVEISLLNGSNVRMILQADQVEVATEFGKLSVPSKSIVAIDFGLHFPEGIDQRIQTAIKNLGADNFRDRDLAGKALIELGPYSFPAVSEASRSGDLETSRRAKDLLKQLQLKHPKKDLKTSTEDRIVTPNFTIVGHILTPTLKAKAELFGEVDMPVARMRSLRSLAGVGPDVEVTIDAGKYANQGQWMETDFHVDGRSTLHITAKGTVDVWPQQGGQYMCGPNGLQGRNFGNIVPFVAGRKIVGALNNQIYAGALLGKIGEDGEIFTIGERYEGTPETQGKLYLHIGPSPWNQQSSGSYEVKIGRKI